MTRVRSQGVRPGVENEPSRTTALTGTVDKPVGLREEQTLRGVEPRPRGCQSPVLSTKMRRGTVWDGW